MAGAFIWVIKDLVLCQLTHEYACSEHGNEEHSGGKDEEGGPFHGQSLSLLTV